MTRWKWIPSFKQLIVANVFQNFGEKERARAHLLLGTASGTSTNNNVSCSMRVVLLPRLLALKEGVLSHRLWQGVVEPV
jgi:hypothetical protein